MNRRRMLCLGLSGLILLAGVFLFYNFVLTAYSSTSPDNELRASYNRLSSTITVRRLNDNVRWHTGGAENPEFLWSPNSRFLAYTAACGFNRRFIAIMDTVYKNSTHVDLPVLLQSTILGDAHVDRLEVIEWIDNDTMRAEFSGFHNEAGEHISGWFMFELSSVSIIELTLSE